MENRKGREGKKKVGGEIRKLEWWQLKSGLGQKPELVRCRLHSILLPQRQ
jgi:hypothetical protein